MTRIDEPTNQLGTGALPSEAEAWLTERGAVFARMDADGALEFSCRPFRDALADAVRDLLTPRPLYSLPKAQGKRPSLPLAKEPPAFSMEDVRALLNESGWEEI